jgi:hypothetical protein
LSNIIILYLGVIHTSFTVRNNVDSKKKVKLSPSALGIIAGSLVVAAAAITAFVTKRPVNIPESLKKRLPNGNVKKS